MLLALALGACTGPDTSLQRVYPNMIVTPEDVSFGDVAVHYSGSMNITVVNGGPATLQIDSLDIVSSTPDAFTIETVEQNLPLILKKDETTTLRLGFLPETYVTYTGSLAISSNDEEFPYLEVPLSGVGVDLPGPDIDVDPTSWDFGAELAAGSQNYFEIAVNNVGDGPLNIVDVEQFGSGAFGIASASIAGFTVLPDQFASILLAYVPTDTNGDNGTVVITSDDPDESSVTVTLLGNGGGNYEYPTAVIDAPDSAPPRTTVTLDGRGSSDPNGLTPLVYHWALESIPEGSATSGLVNDSTDLTYLPLDIAGDYVVSLSVTNTDGVSSAPARHTIHAIPTEALHVELSWDAVAADLDLHVLNGAGNFFQNPNDCNWCNQGPDWGEVGSGDDPSLDIDDRSGLGPENINILAPAEGIYPVLVHYFEDNGDDATVATVRVYLDGVLFDQWSHILYRDDVWTVGDINWPEATVGLVDTVDTNADHRTCQAAK